MIGDLQHLEWSGSDVIALKQVADTILSDLRALGPDALLPIRNFLLDTKDSESLPPELRSALVDVLLGLGLPEVEGVCIELLAAGSPPPELWRLGVYLDAVDSDKYSGLIQSAAELALMEADPAVVLPPEFFALLGELGNENTAALLADAPPHREVYASFALAALKDGSGLPILEQRARSFADGRDTIEGRLALELLAQSAPRSPVAAAALIELARQGVFPGELWPHILDIVAGNWEPSLIEPPPEQLLGSHSYFQPEGRQIIYRAARDPLQADDGLDGERLYLLDQLRRLAPPDLDWAPDS